jgi:hypothetical protein
LPIYNANAVVPLIALLKSDRADGETKEIAAGNTLLLWLVVYVLLVLLFEVCIFD